MTMGRADLTAVDFLLYPRCLWPSGTLFVMIGWFLRIFLSKGADILL